MDEAAFVNRGKSNYIFYQWKQYCSNIAIMANSHGIIGGQNVSITKQQCISDVSITASALQMCASVLLCFSKICGTLGV